MSVMFKSRGKGMFYPHIRLINRLSLCIYFRFRNKYRRNNNKSWIKLIINKLGKFGHEKITFAIFICRDMNWTIVVQTTEQQRPRKEKYKHLDYGGQWKMRRINSILWWNQIDGCKILRISWSWGSFLSIYLSKSYIKPSGETNS